MSDLRLHEAKEALRLAQIDPARSEAIAEAIASTASGGKPLELALAERALGLVARERHDLVASARHLRRSVKTAEAAGLVTAAAESRVSLIGTLALSGQWAAAEREAERAEPALRGLSLARLRTQRATMNMEQGRLDEALQGFRLALPVLRRHDDREWEARLYSNRGLVRYHRNDLQGAEDDLRRAEGLLCDLSQDLRAARARHNLGMVIGLRGNVPEALSCFERADAYFRATGHVDAMGLNDRCMVLLASRLVAEARRYAKEAVDALADEGRLAHLAHARLTLAEAALLDGDLVTARMEANLARTACLKQGRPAWAALASHVGVRAAWLSGDRSTALLRAARRAADGLDESGFALAGLDARVLVAQLALDLGQMGVARRELAWVSRARKRGPVQLRARAWHAEAMLRLSDGNPRGAKSALAAGMAVLDEYRAVLGATELRAHAAGHVAELATMGMALALDDGRPDQVLAWAERWRAGTIRLRPARPPGDTLLAGYLGELRSVVAAHDQAALDGRPTARLRARQTALEEAVRGRSRQASGVFGASFGLPVTPAELGRALGGVALVELAESDGLLHAVVVTDGRARLRRLAPVEEVCQELDRLRASLRRMALGTSSAASAGAYLEASTFGARRLDGLLLAPLLADVEDRPLVMVPTGLLHALPWSLLPSLVGRPVTVAPSATVWHRASSAPVQREGDVVLVAGPRLPGAAAEVASLARSYPGSHRLTGADAVCPQVCRALNGARLAHVAAHGRFRADNPLFSCLELADGPLTVYDLEALDRAPATLVLSACESGSSAVSPGDELMGLVAALLALGTRTVIASVFPVPDDATRPLMLALHRGLRAGIAPAPALARAQAASTNSTVADRAASAAFVCFGAGL